MAWRTVSGAALGRRRRLGIGARLRGGARRGRLARPSVADLAEPEPGDADRRSRVDVRDREAVDAAVAALAERTAPLGAVVYAAGTARVTPILEIEPREWDLRRSASTSRGAFNVLRAAAPHIADGGSYRR